MSASSPNHLHQRDPEPTVDVRLRLVSHPILDQLHRLRRSNDVLTSLRRSSELAHTAGRVRAPGRLAAGLLAFAGESTLAALLAIETLAPIRHRRADEALAQLLSRPEPVVRRHASWRLSSRRPVPWAVAPLLEQLTAGGLDTMHAHRTLRRWAALDSPENLSRLLDQRLDTTDDPARRARLVDLLGVVADPGVDQILRRIATDRADANPARIAAIGALGQRPGGATTATLLALTADDSEIGAHAALALPGPPTGPEHPTPGRTAGLRITQLVLAGSLDSQLSNGGRGDTGGVASLLVSLGEALARRDDVAAVLTIGRGTVSDALAGPVSPIDGTPLSYATVAFGDDARPGTTPDEMWEHLPAIERGIGRVLDQAGPTDLLHVRMADAGTLAGSDLARARRIPICFSPAPDPHNVMRSMQARGELDRDNFPRLEADNHLWFRARLVERLAHESDGLALFPRSHPIELSAELGIDAADLEHRSAVVAEGIDLALVRRAEARYADPDAITGPVPDVIDELARRIPPDRSGLPLVISVGRLNPVKGMARLVAAWAADPLLAAACNLVIVGGDLTAPSAPERAVLDAIHRAVPPDDPRRAGLVLLGGRPRADVAHLLAATVRGQPGAWAGGGIYADGALKEEFGLAVLEALAAGLVVVAPATGGPPTYVDHGHTGILAGADDDLAAAIHAAFGLVARPARIEQARRMVEDRYSIDTMAAQLTELYRQTGIRR